MIDFILWYENQTSEMKFSCYLRDVKDFVQL